MIHLASRSPRRRELLEQLGLRHVPVPADVPEQRAPGERPEDYVRRVARDKAQAGAARVGPEALVLAADTEVVLDDRVYGKPRDADDAAGMLQSLSGREHRVLSAVVVRRGARVEERLSTTRVRFVELPRAWLEAYLATGEWEGKAGAYAIQGQAGAFVASLEGSHSGVMGLPVHETALLLASFGAFPPVP